MKKFIAAITLCALATTGTALAHPGRQARAHRRQVIRQLQLTDAQKQQIRAIRQQTRDANQSLIASVRAKRTELRELRRANDPRADAVRAELKGLMQQLRASRRATRQQIATLLTDEQRSVIQRHRGR